MSKKRKPRKRHHTPLKRHKRERKKLIAPFNELPNLRPTNWVADSLPELLWAAAMLCEYERPAPAWAVLEALDPFVVGDELGRPRIEPRSGADR